MKNPLRFISITALLLLLITCKPQESLVTFTDGSHYGVKTISGKIIKDAGYDYAEREPDGTILIRKNHLYGLLNKSGKQVLPCEYETIDYSDSGFYEVKQHGRYGFATPDGKLITPCIYEFTWGFSSGLAPVQLNGKWGYINAKGKMVIPNIYDAFEYNEWKNGVMGVCKDRKWGFIDQYNNTVIPFDYTEVRPFSEGLALVQKDYGKYGYIDIQGNEVIPFIYDMTSWLDFDAYDFHNGRAVVVQDGLVGCINKKGEIIIPIKYHSINPFYGGYAFAELDNGEHPYSDNWKVVSFGYIDSTGKEFFMPAYDSTSWISSVSPAPSEIPDLSDTLGYYVPEPYVPQVNYDGYFVLEPSHIHYDSVTAARMKMRSDSIARADSIRKADEERIRIEKAKWTLEKLLITGCNAFKGEPENYPDLNKITEVSISYGLMMGGGNYSADFMYPSQSGWEIFKEGTIYKIIGSEPLRSVTWNWAMPYYKQTFETMHPFHQQVYKDIIKHLKNYIDNYDEKKMMDYLLRDEPHFAHYDPDGKYNKYRKLEAFVDRLILLHKVISVEDAKTWIDKTADEVATW